MLNYAQQHIYTPAPSPTSAPFTDPTANHAHTFRAWIATMVNSTTVALTNLHTFEILQPILDEKSAMMGFSRLKCLCVREIFANFGQNFTEAIWKSPLPSFLSALPR
ncbi:MAG: hypothetical protein ACI4AM_08775, partial [Muribaculaceae bacterium]